MPLRDAKPQVLFLEKEPDCHLVCLIPSTHIPARQSLSLGREPGAVWLRALAACVAHLSNIRSFPPPKSALLQADWATVTRGLNGALMEVRIDSGRETRGGFPTGLEFELS